jgi:hypothetical protein
MRDYFFNPNNPKKSYDVYIDKNPNDTINIKYTTIQDVKDTIKKLEYLYKNDFYPHKRIWQVGMIMMVRLRALNKNTPNKTSLRRYNLSLKYFEFLGKRTKLKTTDLRKKFKFYL